MRFAQRQNHRIFSGRSLQFKVETAAEAFAQRQSISTIDPRTEGRMNHQLHATAFIKEAFKHQTVLRRQFAEHDSGRTQIINQLPRCGFTQLMLLHQHVNTVLQ